MKDVALRAVTKSRTSKGVALRATKSQTSKGCPASGLASGRTSCTKARRKNTNTSTRRTKPSASHRLTEVRPREGFVPTGRGRVAARTMPRRSSNGLEKEP
eukprot:CAMPEP_0114568366 /NCGR_PEP_ID=MMETSP0114-20121206/16020_1 /TAXON_ID=31324 /ORGANISM="Goniomonas sp, Strain m" /LENGTH=100 /DNA_ID=CAMNT_0001755105 /DNA_START=73 /DNA_END=372 /DNA_ORIENTATION=-